MSRPMISISRPIVPAMPMPRATGLSMISKRSGVAPSANSTRATMANGIHTTRSSSHSRNARLLQPRRKPSRQVGAAPVASI